MVWENRKSDFQSQQDKAFFNSANPEMLKRNEEILKLEQESMVEPELQIFEDFPDFGIKNTNPEKIVYAKQLSEILKQALDDPTLLPPGEKQILIDYYVSGKNANSIAKNLGIKKILVVAHLSHALNRIRNSKYFKNLDPKIKGPSELNI